MTAQSNSQDSSLGKELQWAKTQISDLTPLKTGEIHVWCLPLQLDHEQTDAALKRLNEHQRDKYNRRATKSLQASYLAGRYFLSELLSAYTQQHPNDLKLSYTRLNKPYLKSSATDLNFNFTDSHGHAGNLGIFVFANGSNIGVDVEALTRRSNFSPIAKRKFTEKENNWVNGYDGELIPERFLALWTRKEAYGKATGLGVNYPMNKLELLLNADHSLNFCGLDEPQKLYRMQQFLIHDSHIACFVHEGEKALKIKAFTN